MLSKKGKHALRERKRWLWIVLTDPLFICYSKQGTCKLYCTYAEPNKPTHHGYVYGGRVGTVHEQDKIGGNIVLLVEPAPHVRKYLKRNFS